MEVQRGKIFLKKEEKLKGLHGGSKFRIWKGIEVEWRIVDRKLMGGATT